MIGEIQRVTGDECRKQIQFLQKYSHVDLATPLLAGRLVLEKGVIRSRQLLGNASTIFTNLGGIRARDLFGTERFRVREVREVLDHPGCTDAASRERYDDLIQKLRAGTQEMNITIDRPSGMIEDGNKSAAAYHDEHSSEDEIELSVYLVRPPAAGEKTGCG